jgi:hypothetical protein
MAVMRAGVALVRLAMSALVIVAVIATYVDTASRTRVNPFNFFGFFTVQSNVIAALIIISTTILGLAGRRVPGWLVSARAAWTTYMIIVGLVYNTLLTGLAGGVALPWANTVVHVVFPIYCLLDWVLLADRPPLSWKLLRWIVVYPLVWAVVVLIRGATDGWVPYPFLDPQLGYGVVLGYVAFIAVAVVGFGVAVLGLSRVRVLGV